MPVGTIALSDEGRAAHLVPPQDPPALALSLANLLGDPDLRDELDAFLRARAEGRG